jgi:hypothetical protein
MMTKTNSYVVLVQGQFVTDSAKLSDEYPNAKQFGGYVSAVIAANALHGLSGKKTEVYENYGTDKEELVYDSTKDFVSDADAPKF